MYNRYGKVQTIINNSDMYSDFFKKRKINFINQYSTYSFENLKLIQNSNLDRIIHTFQPFDKLYNISQKYYNSPDFGWLICYTNKLGSELEIKIGDNLDIYFPLGKVLELLNG